MDRRTQLKALIAPPTRTRRLYQRGGFDGLEANTLQVLIAVELLGQPTVGELVEELALAQGTVSVALARLREGELVITEGDVADARRQRQRIAPRGEELVGRFLQQCTPLI